MNSTTLQTLSCLYLCWPASMGRPDATKATTGPRISARGSGPCRVARQSTYGAQVNTHTHSCGLAHGQSRTSRYPKFIQLRPTTRTQLPTDSATHASTRTPSTNGTYFNSGQQSRLTRHRATPIDELRAKLECSRTLVSPQTRQPTPPTLARSPHSSSSTLRDGIRAVPHLSKPCLPQCIVGAGRGPKSTPAPSVEQLRNKCECGCVRTQKWPNRLA